MTLIAFSEVGNLMVEAEFRGKSYVYKFDSWPLPGLTRQIAVIFANAVATDGWVRGRASAHSQYYAARRLVRHISSTIPQAEPVRIGSLTPEHFDGFDAALRERYPDSTTGHEILRSCVQMLREADLRAHETPDLEADSAEPVPLLTATLSPEARRRVQWTSRLDRPESVPLDSYSPTVAAMLRSATENDIDEVTRRYTVDGPRMVAEGQPPVPGAHARACDVAWLINAEGPVTQLGLRERFGRQDHIQTATLNSRVFPSERDLAPFLIRLGLDTGIPIECLKTLTSDCLRNPNKGRVTIRYLKRRAGGQRWQTKVVRDGHPLSPGGLIRAVLTLTRRAREITGSNQLWVGLISRNKLGQLGFSQARGSVFRRFVRDHALRDGSPGEDGKHPYLRLNLRRLRKTYKVERIRATRGRIRDWADDHSVDVAANHYGNVPELRGEHEAAIEAALVEALAVVAPSVPDERLPNDNRPQDDERDVRVEPTVTSVPGVDLWVATCRDPYDSPHGRKGTLCPVAFFGCLRCGNATIHLGKLPGIIQYLNHLVNQRDRMTAEDWAAVHRDSHNQIVAHILPMFSETDLAKARAVAESTRRLVFLPPDLSTMEVA